MDQNSFIASKIEEILQTASLNLTKTPTRAASIFTDHIFWGLDPKNFPKITPIEEAPSGIVNVKNIPFISFCEHHLVPFFGKVNVSYIPHKLLIGFSKVHEIVHYFSKRPQLQERLCEEIGQSLIKLLDLEHITVQITAKHFCIALNNCDSLESEIETVFTRGSIQ